MIEISRDFILQLHDNNLRIYGGDYGFVDEGIFEMLCVQPFQYVFGQELYPSLYNKAAKFVEGFATHQAFCDGNKRTGFAAMNMFLSFNGIELTLSEEQAKDFVLDIAEKRIVGIEVISRFIEENSMPFDTKQIEMIDDPYLLKE